MCIKPSDARMARGAPLVVERAVADVRDVVGGQVEHLGDVVRDVQHRALLLRADVVRLPDAPLDQDRLEGRRYVLHKQIAPRRLRVRTRQVRAVLCAFQAYAEAADQHAMNDWIVSDAAARSLTQVLCIYSTHAGARSGHGRLPGKLMQRQVASAQVARVGLGAILQRYAHVTRTSTAA